MRFTNFHEFIPWTGINPSASEQKKIIISNIIISNVRCSLFKISWKICFVQGSRDFYNLKKEQGTFDKGGRGEGGEKKKKKKKQKKGEGGEEKKVSSWIYLEKRRRDRLEFLRSLRRRGLSPWNGRHV